MTLGHLKYRFDGSPVQQSKIARVQRDLHVRKLVDQAVEDLRRPQFEPALARARLPDAIDDLVAFTPQFDHLPNEFRWVLQIGIQNNDASAAGSRKPRGYGRLVAKVSREHHHPRLRIADIE